MSASTKEAQARHTPGPWRVQKQMGVHWIMPDDENAEPVASVSRWGKLEDASLIAAAPELLEALVGLQNAASYVEETTNHTNRNLIERWREIARAAIAKCGIPDSKETL